MVSGSGRYVIVFNGEIYNHKAIRANFTAKGALFRGHSDTEVMLVAFESLGVRAALELFNGMFAFAVLDRSERVLYLARDRLGEKPLYFARSGTKLTFASELKALYFHRAFEPCLSVAALPGYFRNGYVSGTESIVSGVEKVKPGCFVVVKLDEAGVAGLDRGVYWSAIQAAAAGLQAGDTWSDRQAIDDLDALLTDAVGSRMEADVPLGAFLSGGIDSSIVVAMMQKQAARPVKTFSIGFWEKRFNEADVAKRVAAHLGTEHTELYVTPQQALDVIPRLPTMYDEPFADSSQIPTYLVAQMARQHVTVALSGDGGDELFCGYDRYPLALRLWSNMRRMPQPARKAVAGIVKAIPVSSWNRLSALFPERLTAGRLGDRLHKIADRIVLKDFDSLYRGLMAMWQYPLMALNKELMVTDNEHPLAAIAAFESLPDRMMAWDVEQYLPDDILVKVDRASMAVSLEGRMPLLDHRVVELAWRIPLTMKWRNGTGKWLLRQVLSKYVPDDVVNRRKQGFGVPIEYWLRHELRDWTCDMLSPATLRRDGVLDEGMISKMLQEHLAGQRSWSSQLWSVLMFQAWYAEFRSSTR